MSNMISCSLPIELPNRSTEQMIFYLQLLRLAKGLFHVPC